MEMVSNVPRVLLLAVLVAGLAVDSTRGQAILPIQPPIVTLPPIVNSAQDVATGCPTPIIENGRYRLVLVKDQGEDAATEGLFTCIPGFLLEGRPLIKCLVLEERWEHPLPTCTEIIECASAPCLNGGTCNDQVNGYVCACPPGYTGTECQTAVNCDEPGQVVNGNTEFDGTAVGDQVRWTCNRGYAPTDLVTAVCQDDGQWSRPPPTCNNIDECRSGPCLNGGTCTDQVNGYVCVCPPGYTGTECQTPLDCDEPGRVVNGQTTWDGTTYGDRVLWTCNPGYTIVGLGTAVCQADRLWSRQPPTCEVSCFATLPDDFLQTSRLVSSSVPVPDCGKTAADIIVVVDESDSMKPAPKDWLHLIMRSLERSLQQHGVGLSAGLPNQYTLVGFGRVYFQNDMGPYSKPHVMTSDAGSQVYDVEGFGEACQRLEAVGSIEDGYMGMKYALENITDTAGNQLLRLRQDNVAPIVILVTDEDRDVRAQNGRGITRSSIKRTIRRSGACMEAIVDNSFLHNQDSGFGMDAAGMLYSPGLGGSNYVTKYPGSQYKRYLRHNFRDTRNDYTSVALELGGAAWDLNKLFLGSALDPAHVNAVVDRTVALVTQRVHKCCSCECTPIGGSSGSYLRCSAAASVGDCTLGRPVNRFRG